MRRTASAQRGTQQTDEQHSLACAGRRASRWPCCTRRCYRRSSGARTLPSPSPRRAAPWTTPPPPHGATALRRKYPEVSLAERSEKEMWGGEEVRERERERPWSTREFLRRAMGDDGAALRLRGGAGEEADQRKEKGLRRPPPLDRGQDGWDWDGPKPLLIKIIMAQLSPLLIKFFSREFWSLVTRVIPIATDKLWAPFLCRSAGWF